MELIEFNIFYPDNCDKKYIFATLYPPALSCFALRKSDKKLRWVNRNVSPYCDKKAD
jgi:hypothetical protein